MCLPPFVHAGRMRSLVALLAAALAAISLNLILASGDALARSSAKPTVVLVHGAFADASGWNDVIGGLQRRGIPSSRPPTRCAA